MLLLPLAACRLLCPGSVKTREAARPELGSMAVMQTKAIASKIARRRNRPLLLRRQIPRQHHGALPHARLERQGSRYSLCRLQRSSKLNLYPAALNVASALNRVKGETFFARSRAEERQSHRSPHRHDRLFRLNHLDVRRGWPCLQRTANHQRIKTEKK